jgi:hypothetical protein
LRKAKREEKREKKGKMRRKGERENAEKRKGACLWPYFSYKLPLELNLI